jgi:hypothetical protein
MVCAVKLLLRDNVIYEGILSTIYNGKPYVSAVGFVKRGDFIEVKAYRGSLLYTVIRESSRVVLNVVHDVLTLIYSAFKGYFDLSVLENNIVHKGDLVYLRNSLAHIVVEKILEEEHGDHCIVRFKIASYEVCESPIIEPFTRCYSNLVEIAVYASKILSVKNTAVSLLFEYQKRVNNCLDVVMRTCNDEYKQLASKLVRLIRSVSA